MARPPPTEFVATWRPAGASHRGVAVVVDRIAFFRKTWDVTELLARRYWAAREVEELIERQAGLDRIAAAMRAMVCERVQACCAGGLGGWHIHEEDHFDPILFEHWYSWPNMCIPSSLHCS